MASGKKGPPARRPSDAEVHASIERTRIKTTGWTIVCGILGLAIVLLSSVPLAHAIAGRKTDFEVNVTLSLSIVFSVSITVSTTFAFVYRRVNRRLRRRNQELENDLLKERQRVAQLEEAVTDANGRIQDLEEAAGS